MKRYEAFRFVARVLGPADQDGRTVSSLREDLDRGAIGWELVVEVASRQLVTPTVYRALADKGLIADLPAEVRCYLEAIHQLNGDRNRRIAEQLREIVATLNRSSIEPVLLKGIAHLRTNLYGDPAARVIGDIDLLVRCEQLAIARDALAASAYQEGGIEDSYYHHHAPLAHSDRPACVELHTDPVAQTFSTLLSAERVIQDARRLTTNSNGMWVPSLRDQVVHNVVHTQLADRNYWCGRISLRQLSDLSRLRIANDGGIDWEEIRGAFDRAGYGDVCRTYLLVAEQLFGQTAPPELRPGVRARLASWQVDLQIRSSWLMLVGASYGYHRAILSEVYADPIRRRKVLTRLLHPAGYRDYLRYLKKYVGRIG